MSKQDTHLYEFGPYRLNPKERLLLRGGEPVTLAPKAFETLVALVRRSGRLVEKDELLDEVWAGAHVEESNIAQNVFALRRALGAAEGGGKYIATVPKRGYRFLASVRVVDETAEEQSIAVLPFRPLGAGEKDEYLELGMADALITKLSNVKQLVVRPTSSIRAYTPAGQDPATAGRALQVESVLVGEVQRAGERVRVTVQLISVREGRSVWAEKFDEPFTDIFGVQDAISERVAEALRVRLTGSERELLARPPTDNIEAYQSYLRGNYYLYKFTPDDLNVALRFFNEAIARDGAYALAYAGLSNAYGIASSFGDDEAALRAEAAAAKAIEFDPTLAEAHAALAAARFWQKRDPRAAQDSFDRALALNPNSAVVRHFYAWYLIARGSFVEGEQHMRRALELDPLSPTINVDQGLPLFYARRYDEARARYERAMELDVNYPYAHLRLGEACEGGGDFARAVSEFRRAFVLSNNDPTLRAQLARALALAGQRAEARQLLDEITSKRTQPPPSAYYLALAYASLGEATEACVCLEHALAKNDKWLGWVAVDPRLDPLRSDPRFSDLLVLAAGPVAL